MKLLSTKEIIAKYGKPNQQGTYLTTIKLPYPMRIAWDPKTKVTKMRCHRLVAVNFMGVFSDLLQAYGYDRLVELGIDLFGGCFQYRKMRGGSDWSRHSWGIAIDIDPSRNQLMSNHTKATLDDPDYDQMRVIFNKWGFVGLGQVADRDWMHWEIAS